MKENSAGDSFDAEDAADLLNARKISADDQKPKSFWKCLGPGLVTGAADDDPAGIGSFSAAGAQFGYSLVWIVPFCIPLMIAVQEMCGRIGIVTGAGLAEVIKRHYPSWILYSVVLLLILANLFNIYADLNVMAASTQMLFGGSIIFWLILLATGMVAALILVPYRIYVSGLKWLAISLLAYVITAFLPSVNNDWGKTAYHLFVPAWSWHLDYLIMVVALLGTTISPYLFFWQTSEEVEEDIAEGKVDAPGSRITPASDEEISDMRKDTSIGMIASQLISFFIIICAAATLHAQGITHIDTAQDAAKALLPLGKTAFWIFTLGILGTGLIAVPTLSGSAAYALAETFGWRLGLYRRFSRARKFYLTIAAMIFTGCGLNLLHAISPVKALLYSSVLNGIITIPLLFVLLLICNNRTIMKDRINGRISNIIGWLTFVIMTGAVAFMYYAMIKGEGV